MKQRWQLYNLALRPGFCRILLATGPFFTISKSIAFHQKENIERSRRYPYVLQALSNLSETWPLPWYRLNRTHDNLRYQRFNLFWRYTEGRQKASTSPFRFLWRRARYPPQNFWSIYSKWRIWAMSLTCLSIGAPLFTQSHASNDVKLFYFNIFC